MDFFGIGAGEIIFILIVALLVWGPNRIVEISRSIAKGLHTMKKAANDITTQAKQELEEQKSKLYQEPSSRNNSSSNRPGGNG